MRSLIAVSAALLATTVLTGAAAATADGPRSKVGYTAKADRLVVARAAADEEEAEAAPRGKGQDKADRVEDEEDDAPRGKRKADRFEDEDDGATRGKRKADRFEDEDDGATRGKRKADRFEDEDDGAPSGKRKADRVEDEDDGAPRGKRKADRFEDEDDAPRGKRRVERLDDDEARELRYRWWKYRMERRALEAPPAHWRWEYRRHLQMRALSRQPVGPSWAHRPYGRPYLQ